MKLSMKELNAERVANHFLDRIVSSISILPGNENVTCLLFAKVKPGLLYVVDIFEETETGWRFKFQASDIKNDADDIVENQTKGIRGLKMLLDTLDQSYEFWLYVTDAFMDGLMYNEHDMYNFVTERIVGPTVDTKDDESTIQLVRDADIDHMETFNCKGACASAGQPAPASF